MYAMKAVVIYKLKAGNKSYNLNLILVDLMEGVI